MIHTAEQMLMKARCLAKKILKMKKEGDIDCHEIDLLAQDAEYLEFDSRDFEDDKKNLDLAIKLIEIKYRKKILGDKLNLRIVILLKTSDTLSGIINSINHLYRNLYTFGSIEKISDKKVIISDGRDRLA